jgi:hypothetical protein
LKSNRPHFAPWDEREWPRRLSAEEGARRVRLFAAIERRQAELLDQWAETVSEPHLQTTLKRHARHASWHAHLWENDITDGASSANGSADADVQAFLDAVASPKGEGELVELLTGVYRVLVPRKVTAYTYYQRAIGTEDSDADWRWIDMILEDEFDAIRDGELSLQSLLKGSDEVDRSAKRKAELETLMVKSGGIVGPDSIGMGQGPMAAQTN